MRIIEYTLGLPPYRRGGLPRYSTDLSEELGRKNKVYLLYPGQINPFSKKITLNNIKTKYNFQTFEMKNPLPVSLGLGIRNGDEKYYFEKRNISVLKKFVEKVKPEVVHFHTIMGVPIEFLEFLRHCGIRTVYTTHDFYGLCPKMLKNNPKKALRISKCSYNCFMCNIGPSYKKIIIMQSHLYQYLKESRLIREIRSKNKSKVINNSVTNIKLNDEQVNMRYELRKYYLKMFKMIDIFHFNSSVSREYFKKFLPQAKGKVIPITHSDLKDNRNRIIHHFNKPMHLGYIGPYDRKKGFFLYTKVLQKDPNNFIADFYGDDVYRKIFGNKKFINHGIISNKNITKQYKKLDLLVVPSLWYETFGYVILEAILQGTPCLVSNNVGSKDLLPNNWIFRSKEELKNKLDKILTDQYILEKMYRQVKHLIIPYDMRRHALKVINELYL